MHFSLLFLTNLLTLCYPASCLEANRVVDSLMDKIAGTLPSSVDVSDIIFNVSFGFFELNGFKTLGGKIDDLKSLYRPLSAGFTFDENVLKFSTTLTLRTAQWSYESAKVLSVEFLRFFGVPIPTMNMQDHGKFVVDLQSKLQFHLKFQMNVTSAACKPIMREFSSIVSGYVNGLTFEKDQPDSEFVLELKNMIEQEWKHTTTKEIERKMRNILENSLRNIDCNEIL